MAAPTITPIRPRLTGAGLAVVQPRRPVMAAIARIPLRCGDIARVHAAVPAADSTIDAWSALALALVLTGGAIDN
jgi:hypothetical protein